MGLANDRSIAYGIAQSCHAQGAKLGFTYQGEVLMKRVQPIAEAMNSDLVLECDVANEASLDATFEAVAEQWGSLDFIIHSIAFSNREELRGRYLDTSKANFLNTMDISCFSLVQIAKRAEKLLAKSGGSIVTLTYYGAEKVVPNYNVMGVAKAGLEASVRYLASDLGPSNIRVNAISAGPLRTLAAAGIAGFNDFLKVGAVVNPLRRNVTLEDIGGTAVYLVSDFSAGMTGEVLHVDAGYHIVGMQNAENAA